MDGQIEEYIVEHLGLESSVLTELYRYTNLNMMYPGMISGHEQGRLLSMLSHMVNPGMILEIGTFTGYSTICLAEGMKANGRLHTIEKDDERAEIASVFFEKAGIADRIVSHIGDALEIIPTFGMIFDLVFIDAAKKQYLEYYHLIFNRVKPGGYILIDNILWYGKVADPQVQDEMTCQLRRFNEFVHRDTRVERAIVQNRDGMFILRKK
jgi:predicted O-methyltransferase YrrM